MKLISIVTACYNEEENIEEIYKQVKEVISSLKNYKYEHIFIDNSSQDKTVSILKEIAGKDKNVKIIVNSRNFGHIRSPFYGLLQAKGDAILSISADLQDPPGLIPEFIKKWEEGYKMVLGVKTRSKESFIMTSIRNFYYDLIGNLSDMDLDLVKNYTGFGLYDKSIIDILKTINDPYPYFRGLISEIGFEKAVIEFTQPVRARGITKNNFYTLYDMAMLGITSLSRVPLRLATFFGFILAITSLLVALIYLVYKLVFWQNFTLGIAPVVIGLFFFSSVQLFFIGIIGEYIGSIHTRVLKRPLVTEKERINF